LSKINLEKALKELGLNGIEYVNHEFSKFLSHNGIIYELTTLEENVVAEKKNCHLLEVSRVLLF